MKKVLILCIFAALLILLCGCAGGIWDEATADAENNPVSVGNSDDNSEGETAFNPLYFANRKSKTFHKSTCPAVKEMKDSNLYITEFRDELINEGYKPCSVCNP